MIHDDVTYRVVLFFHCFRNAAIKAFGKEKKYARKHMLHAHKNNLEHSKTIRDVQQCS